jgi:DNA-directed RNA polymerase subunit RPC12/RpoP
MNSSDKARRLAEIDADIDQKIRMLAVVSNQGNHEFLKDELRELRDERVILDEMPIIRIEKPIDGNETWYNLKCGQCEKEFMAILDGRAVIKCKLCGYEDTGARIIWEYKHRKENEDVQ